MINLIASRKINLKQTLVAVILSLFVLSAMTSLAAGQGMAGVMSVSPTTGAAGAAITVSGTGFSGTVAIKFNFVQISTATVGGNGAFTATITVPQVPAGQYEVSADDTSGHSGDAFFNVASSSVTAPPPTAPPMTPTPPPTTAPTPTPTVPEFAAPILIAIALAVVTLSAIPMRKPKI